METHNNHAPTRAPQIIFDLEDILDARYIRLAILYMVLLISLTSVVCAFYQVDRGIPVALVLSGWLALIVYGISKERNDEAQAWSTGQQYEWTDLQTKINTLKPLADRCRSVEMRCHDVETALKDTKRLLGERSALLEERSRMLEEARAELEKEKKSRAGLASALARSKNPASD